jgi:hypothetical protein
LFFDSLLGQITAFSTLATAVFMYIQLSRTALGFTAYAYPASSDMTVPRELQRNPKIFLLYISFTDVPYPLTLRTVEVTGAKIPHDLCDEAGSFTGASLLDPKFLFGSAPLSIPLSPKSEKLESIWFPIELLNTDAPLVEVEIRYGLFRRASRKVLCKQR